MNQLVDIVGTPLNKGDAVLFPHKKQLLVGIVKKINAKTISISPIDDITISWYYPNAVYVIDHPNITLKILESNHK